MFKLLTEKEKKKVASEYAARRAIVALFALSFVFVIGIIGILPSFLLSNSRRVEALERMKVVESSGKRGDEAELVQWLSGINAKLRVLAPRLDNDKSSAFIEAVEARQVEGITLERFSWKKDGETVALSVSGIAHDRQTLISFEDSIRSSEFFF